MRVFLDSSVWFAAILSPTGGSGALLELLSSSDTRVLISHHVIKEVVRNLSEKAPSQAKKFSDWYGVLHPEVIKPPRKLIKQTEGVINKKDAFIVAAAVTGKADLLVTLDRKHYFTQELQKFLQPMIVALPGDALKLLRQQQTT